jgi:uncharacterized protein (TIGR03435 family)
VERKGPMVMKRALLAAARVAVIAGSIVAGILDAQLVSAQSSDPQPSGPAFEVASVKINPRDDTPEGISLRPDGSAHFTGFQVRTLITIAYRSEGLQRFDQLVGAPSWLSRVRFDIEAKAGGDSRVQGGPTQLPAMLRSLLSDRFRLRVHSEQRNMPAYALVMARRDRRLGPELRESTSQCPGNAGPAAGANPDLWCGIRAKGGMITGQAVSAALLAGNLSGYPTVDRFVADRTGLTGRYDFKIEYSPGPLQPGDAVATDGPSLFTALTEQLGLRLQPETLLLPVLVIDHVEQPAPD